MSRAGPLWLALLLTVGACGWLADDTAPTGDQGGEAIAVDTSAVDSAASPEGPPIAPAAGDSVTAGAGETIDAPDGAATPEQAPATEPVAEVLARAAGQDTLSLENRLDLLIASQQALTRRIDSLVTTAGVSADSVSEGPGGGEVLDEASRQVQNFGVGVFWSAIVLVLFNIFIRATVWLLDTLAERNASRRLFYKRLVPIVRIVLWIFAAYLIVSVIFRVDAQGIFAAAAAIGVAVGFAAQDLLKNLFGGMILVFDQPFQVGDKVSVGGTYGEVVSIGLRSTRIVTPDDNLVSVPNAQVVDQQVANANAGELNCQVVTDLFLPGWADERTAKKIAFDAAATSKYVYLNKPIVVMVADVFKETFLTRVRVKAYVMDPRLEFLFQSDVTERARDGFRKAGLLRPEHIGMALVQRSALADPTDLTPPATVDGEDEARG